MAGVLEDQLAAAMIQTLVDQGAISSPVHEESRYVKAHPTWSEMLMLAVTVLYFSGTP